MRGEKKQEREGKKRFTERTENQEADRLSSVGKKGKQSCVVKKC